MNRLTATIFAALSVGMFSSCKYDDSELWNEVKDHENRIAQLEELCNQMNTNISSLQTIVSALQNNDYVTSITPITSGNNTIGYTINFSKSGPVTIYHGQDGKDGVNGEDGKDGADGKDGHTPVLGVKMTSDGNYYWTIDGEWLLDDEGNKIRANGIDGQDGTDGSDGENGQDGQDGTNGKDGVTPQLKIEDGYWYISYDNGLEWTQLWKATGEDGKDGADGQDGDSMFSRVTYDDDFVYLVLADNTTTLMIPRKDDEFSITFPNGNDLVCSSGETVSIPYILTYGDSGTEVSAIPHGGWEATVEKIGNTSGDIIVTAPNPMKDGEIIILASDGKEKTIMRKLLVKQGVVSIVTKSYLTDSNASTIDVELSTNLDYTVSIPDDAKSWISVSDIHTKATMRNDVISLDIAANINDATRTATVSLVNSVNEVLNTVTISQTGAKIANNEIWYISSDDNIIEPDTYYFSGTIVSNTYGNGKGVIVFEDDLTEIWKNAFRDCNKLIAITIPNGVTIINSYAFSDCSSLIDISISQNITTIGFGAFSNCHQLKDILLPYNLTYITQQAFAYCEKIERIIIPNSVTTIEGAAFQNCESLKEVVLSNNIVAIQGNLFWNCISLNEIIIPDNVTKIEDAFNNCTSLELIYCKPLTPPILGLNGLGIPVKTIIYVPEESVEQYKSDVNWSQYASQIVGYDFRE